MTRGLDLQEFARGWRGLLAGTLGMTVATTAIPFYTLGIFMRPLELANGWSRAQISVAASLLGFLLPIGTLYVGTLVDRVGVRRIAASGHLVLGLIFLCLSLVEANLWLFWAGYAAAALLGAGASPITYTRPLIASFDRHRGLALGICLSGAGIGASVAPPALGAVVREYGWGAGYAVLGIAVLLATPFALWLLPKAGETSSRRDLQRTPLPHAQARNVSAAPRALLALLSTVFFVVALAVNGLLVHFVPLLIDSGMHSTAAVAMAGLIGIAVIAGRLIIGWLLDRMPVGVLASILFATTAIGIALLASFGTPMALVAALVIGFTVGAEVDLVAFIVSRVYSPEQYAYNYSRVYSMFMLGAGISPVLGGWIHDRFGTYGPFLIGASAGLAVIAIFFLNFGTLMERLSVQVGQQPNVGGRCAGPPAG